MRCASGRGASVIFGSVLGGRALQRATQRRPCLQTSPADVWLPSTQRLTAPWTAVLSSSRRTLHTQKEEIHPDDISFLSPEASRSSGPATDGRSSNGEGSFADDGGLSSALRAAASPQVPSAFVEVKDVDPFSRAKVINFVKRYSKRSLPEGGKGLFTTEEVGYREADGTVLYHTRIQLPLPLPRPANSASVQGDTSARDDGADSSGQLWAHGVALDAKEAELLAAMHAERIVDELGYHLYTLPSMQRKHAATARAQGRFAPSPDDIDAGRLSGLVSEFPLPLRRVAARDESEGGVWQLVNIREGKSFQSASPSTTLLSPCVMDAGARARVQLFFRFHKTQFTEVLTVLSDEPTAKGRASFFVAEIVILPALLPSGTDEKVMARGKAQTRDDAVVLACMHAELVLDALGIVLFPQDDAKQKEHAMTAWRYGRPAPLSGSIGKPPSHVSLPLPLKELVIQENSKRYSPPNYEEDLVHRHRVVTSQTTEFKETAVAEATALEDLTAFLKSQKQPRAENPFFHEGIQGLVKSTVVLPLSSALGIRGGVGIAGKAGDADVLAAMHALDVLTALGVPVKPDAQQQKRWVDDRCRNLYQDRTPPSIAASQPSPPGRRLASNLKCFGGSFRVSDTEKVRGPLSTTDAPSESAAISQPSSTPADERSPTSAPPAVTETPAAASATPLRPRRVVKRAKAAVIANTNSDPVPLSAQSAVFVDADDKVPPSRTRDADNSDAQKNAEPTRPDLHDVRQRVPREQWSMEADSPDGYIMVAPNTVDSESRAGVEGTFSSDAIICPRVLDVLAKERVVAYLASMGRRFEDVFVSQFMDEDGNGGLGMHRCVAQLPVPQRFGDRVAIGEAATGPDAVHLAAMHAELTLDTLGICLFTDGKRQLRHAEVCEQHGRWCPRTADDEQPPSTRSPPPLRREYVGSLHWERMMEKRRLKPVSIPRPGQSSDASAAECQSTRENVNDEASKENQAKKAHSASPVPVAAAEDLLPTMEMDETVAYTLVDENEVDLVSKMRVQYYLRRRGVTAVESEYTIVMGRGTILHEAEWVLPLPKGILKGEETCDVKGTAATKRDAEILSWMHAERTLDMLGVPLFDNLPKLQQWHAERVSRLGRRAPLCDTSADTHSAALTAPTGGTVVSAAADGASPTLIPPLRLRSTTASSGQTPVSPVPSYPEEESLRGSDGKQVWNAYVEGCALHIQTATLAGHNAFFAIDRVPRTGDPLVDTALDDTEDQPTDVDSKMQLQLYCNAAGVQYPSYWKTQTVGPLTHRVSWAVVPVPGFETVYAQGVGANRESAQRRAASHAMAMLTRLDSDFSSHHTFVTSAPPSDKEEKEFDLEAFTVSLDPLQEVDSTQAKADLVAVPKVRSGKNKQQLAAACDTVTGLFTFEGKVRAVELLSLCLGVAPPRTTHLVRVSQTNVLEPREVRGSAEVGLTDDEGKSWRGRSGGRGAKANARAAYEDLFSQLDVGMPLFQQVKEVLRKDPLLNPRLVPNAVIERSLKARIHALVGDGPAAALEDEAARTQEVEEKAVDLQQILSDSRNRVRREGSGDAAAEDCGDVSRLISFVAMNEAEVAQESQYLLEKHQDKITAPAYIENYAKARERLSISSRREEITRGIENNQVLIICGTTGCGKTTQVPQFILDHLTNQGRGGNCSILVTQPRRLSAVSIAQRVAAERLESIGDSTGYTIRFNSHPGKHINFCTSGVLLRMLHTSPKLDGINYLIVDEIHERDINSDFLLILLRRLLNERSDLRVILMSATLQAEQFAVYFGNAPIINVEGYVYPVQELYLEDLVPFAEEHHFMTPLLKEAAAVREKATRRSPWTTADAGDAYERQASDAAARGIGASSLTDINSSSAANGDKREKYGVLEATTDIDYPTVQFAVEQAARMVDLSQSSLLVFLPGWDEIIRAKEILERNLKYQIITLHSSVGQEEQMRCFLPAEEGKIKVILSTNIAESGVTIDDVGAVIDVGRAKEKSYTKVRGRANDVQSDSYSDVSQLLTVYASRANCVQRRGRVGRTRPGVCLRLYSKVHFETLHDFQTPEMLRTPLDALCLQILSLGLGDPAHFLDMAMEPPTPSSVEAAMARLRDLGATTTTRQLTALGLRLSMLPVEPKIGKIIIMGALLKCLDSALTIASVTSTDVFVPARSSRDAVRLHKEDLSRNTQSDMLASVNGFNFWVTAHYQRSSVEVVSALGERLLSVPQLMLVSRHKRQFYDILKHSGFLDYWLRQDRVVGDDEPAEQGSHDVFVEHSSLSTDALNVGLVKCVVAAGLFPNVAMSQGRRLLRTKGLTQVSTSSDSVLHRTAQRNIKQPYFVFSEVVKSAESNRISVRGLTNVSLWTLIFMGTASMPISYNRDLSLATVNEWLPFRVSFGTLELLRKLKQTTSTCLSRAYINPDDRVNNEKLEQLRQIIKDLVNCPLIPNRLGEDAITWEELGTLIAPVCTTKDANEPAPSGESASTATEVEKHTTV